MEFLHNALETLKKYNQMPIHDMVKEFENFSEQKIDPAIVNTFKLTGLENVDLMTSDFLNRHGLKNLLQVVSDKKVEEKQPETSAPIDIMEATKNPCIVCGAEVRWGFDGCPTVNKGSETSILMGQHNGMIHYGCTESMKQFAPENRQIDIKNYKNGSSES